MCKYRIYFTDWKSYPHVRTFPHKEFETFGDMERWARAWCKRYQVKYEHCCYGGIVKSYEKKNEKEL